MSDQVVKGHGWSATPNALLRDGKTSATAKVVYSLLAGFSPDFKFTRRTLQSMAGVGKDTIQKALRELIAKGWIDRHQHRGRAGKFFYTYTIHPVPCLPAPVEPVPCLPAPVPPAPVDQAPLEEHLKEEQNKKEHIQASRPQTDFEQFTIEARIAALFAERSKPVTSKAVARFSSATHASQCEHVINTLEDVFARVPRASSAKIFSYALENLNETHPARENTHEPKEARQFTEAEIEKCIPFN